MSLDRRKFLKLSTLATCSVTGVSALGNEHFEGYPNSYGMLTDTTICIGANCRKCEEACKKQNDLNHDDFNSNDNSVFDQTRRPDSNNFTIVNRFPNSKNPERDIFVKDQCRHCKEPACASACLVNAFTKTPEGAVSYNKDLCIGCRYCMVACPFDIPAYDYFDAYTPEIKKCNMCYDLIIDGKKPACAAICPEEAITFGPREELINLAREKIRNNPDRYNPHIYGEHEVGGTNWLYLAGVDFKELNFPTDLGVTPYPMLTRGFLSAVPLVLTIWPALLTGFYTFTKHRDNEIEQLKQAATTHRDNEIEQLEQAAEKGGE